MRDFLKINISIPYAIRDARVVISQVDELDEIQSRVLSLLMNIDDLELISGHETLSEAMRKVFNVEKRMHSFISNSIDLLFKGDGTNSIPTLTLKFGDYKTWQDVNVSNIQINETVKRNLNDMNFIGLSSTARVVNEKILIPLMLNENEKFVNNDEYSLDDSVFSDNLEKTFSDRTSDIYVSGLVEKLTKINHQSEIISNVVLRQPKKVKALVPFEFILDGNKIEWTHLKTEKLIEAADQNLISFEMIIDSIKNELDVDNEVFNTDDGDLISFSEFKKLTSKSDKELNHIGISGHFIIDGNNVIILGKKKTNIVFNNHNISIYLPTKTIKNIDEFIGENINFIHFDKCIDIKNSILIKSIIDLSIQLEINNDNSRLLIAKHLKLHKPSLETISFLIKFINVSEIFELIKENKGVFTDVDDISKINEITNISFDNLYKIFKWKYQGQQIFPKWKAEQQFFAALEYIDNFKEKIVNKSSDELLNIKKDILSFTFAPIESLEIENELKNIEQQIRVASDLTLKQASDLSGDVRWKLEQIAFKFGEKDKKTTMYDHLSKFVKKDAKFDEFMDYYSFTSKYLHFDTKNIVTRDVTNKLKKILEKNITLNALEGD